MIYTVFEYGNVAGFERAVNLASRRMPEPQVLHYTVTGESLTDVCGEIEARNGFPVLYMAESMVWSGYVAVDEDGKIYRIGERE